MSFVRRRIDVDASCVGVDATLFRRCVPAGYSRDMHSEHMMFVRRCIDANALCFDVNATLLRRYVPAGCSRRNIGLN